MSYWYLGMPYTDEDSTIIQQRFEKAEEVTATLLTRNIHIYSPIVHCHAMAEKHHLPTDFRFWKEYNYCMLRPAMGLFILELPGWEESVGLELERQFAIKNDILISHLHPEDF